MHQLSALYCRITTHLNSVGTWLPSLFIRLLLAWEFGEAGFEKLHGSNWFADITFPFPFNLLPPDISWGLALTFEIVGAFAIAFGLATRFFATSLFILTIVAIAAVHWPAEWHTLTELLTGYRVIDESNDGFGNYKLPAMYMVLLLPLIFSGAGRLSLDQLLSKIYHNSQC
ncbi:MAG TPA: DoxX family protein [Methylophilus sp.]